MRLIDNIIALFEVTRVARFVTVAGGSVPDENGLSDRHIQDISLPGLVEGAAAVVMYRARASSPEATFTFRVNNRPLTARSGDQGGPYSWHEVVPGGTLKESKNEITLGCSEGSVVFSDIVIMYQSDKTTVVQEPVVAPFNG